MSSKPITKPSEAFKKLPSYARGPVVSILFGCGLLALMWCLVQAFTFYVAPGEIGVKQNNMVGGIAERDFGPGYHLAIPFVHRTYRLNGRYSYLHYSAIADSEMPSLTIRTRDNNNVIVDVSIPLRIVEGGGHDLVRVGLHVGNGYMQRAQNTVVGVLRDRLAELSSEDWYDVERRQTEAANTLEALNMQLAEFNLEAEGVYIRSFEFPQNYENQLQELQLLQQQALLDRAAERRANAQQELDNFLQETQSLVNQRSAWWGSQLAVMENAYQTGVRVESQDEFFSTLVDIGLVNQTNQLAERGVLAGTPEYAQYVATLRAELVAQFGAEEYLIGIEGINAQANRQVAALEGQAESLAPRYQAESSLIIAQIENDGQRQINELLASPGGRSLVALEAAENIQFDTQMTFNSSEVPFILDLERMARFLMGE